MLDASRDPTDMARLGPMAEWLRRGLQILARRFDSGSGLHPLIPFETEAFAISGAVSFGDLNHP